MTGYDDNVTEDLDVSRTIIVPGNRINGKNLIGKLKALVMASLSNRTQKEKLEFAPIVSHLDDVYEFFIKQALELATARSKIETLKLQVSDKDQRMGSFADAARQSVPEVEKASRGTRPDGNSGKTCAAGPSTDQVLLI